MHFFLIDGGCWDIDVLRLRVPRDAVLVYTGGAADAATLEQFNALRASGYRVHVTVTGTPTSNSVVAANRFALFSRLAQLLPRYTGATFTVVATDRSYDPVIAYLRSKGFERISRVTNTSLHPVWLNVEHTLQKEIECKKTLSYLMDEPARGLEDDIALLARLEALLCVRAAPGVEAKASDGPVSASLDPRAATVKADVGQPVAEVAAKPLAVITDVGQPVAEVAAKPLAVITLRRVKKATPVAPAFVSYRASASIHGAFVPGLGA